MFGILGAKKSMKEILHTKDAFKHFVKHFYPTIKPKSVNLRSHVTRFKKGTLSEELQRQILTKYKYIPKDYIRVPETWVVPDNCGTVKQSKKK